MPGDESGAGKPDDLQDMLQELRVLLQGTQVLTAFLVTVPFSQGFSRLDRAERWVFLATFACSVISLVLFSAPAVQHRLERPLDDPQRFKDSATRLMVTATLPLSLALILATHLVVEYVIGKAAALLSAGATALLIAVVWWAIPLLRKRQARR